jgi:thymidylate synthase (FAD)
MKVTLIPKGTSLETPEWHIGEMASICYDSDTSEEACIRRAKKCKDSGHLATLRFAWATFKVDGISRICSHQIVRMAHAGILQRSQRYVKETSVTFIDPPALKEAPLDFQHKWAMLQDLSESVYLEAIENKYMKKEDARYALLHACETSMYLCLNFQGWRDFLRNRAAKHAQWEVRDVAFEIQKELALIAPNIFGNEEV